jgi:hypothetical protein
MPSLTPAASAFVWGFPLVVTHRTFQSFGALLGVNVLYNQASPSTATMRLVVSPNADTLYSVAVVDLRAEPMVLTVPDATDRYWTYQFLDAWTNSFHYIGTRTTAGKGGAFVITPPGWSGTVSANMQAVASPTPVMFLLGRYLYRDAADVTNVVALSRTLAALHTVTGAVPPPAPPALGMAKGTPQQTGNDGASFFDDLGDALALDPPASAFDVSALKSFASLGIGPSLHPASMPTSSASPTALSAGVTSGLARLASYEQGFLQPGSAWTVHLDVGNYTNDTLTRAAIAQIAWGANVPEEAIYAFSQSDSAGAAYSGTKSYVVHFAQLPPVASQGFWSLTMYGPDHFFVSNSINRYAIGDRTTGLAMNADGSLDVYVQSTSPAGHASNWLPSPTGAFEMILRIYLPQQSVLAGTYRYPTVHGG